MKNRLLFIVTLMIILALVLGCGVMERVQEEIGSSTNSNSNQTLTGKAVDAIAGEGKIGVAECDEVLETLSAEANNPDDNFVTKALKKSALNKFREQIKTRIEEQKANKVELAKMCKDAKANLDKYKAEPESNKQ